MHRQLPRLEALIWLPTSQSLLLLNNNNEGLVFLFLPMVRKIKRVLPRINHPHNQRDAVLEPSIISHGSIRPVAIFSAKDLFVHAYKKAEHGIFDSPRLLL